MQATATVNKVRKLKMDLLHDVYNFTFELENNKAIEKTKTLSVQRKKYTFNILDLKMMSQIWWNRPFKEIVWRVNQSQFSLSSITPGYLF